MAGSARHSRDPRLVDAVLRSLGETIIVVAPDYSIAFLNPGPDGLFTLDADSWVGRSILDVVHPDDVFALTELLAVSPTFPSGAVLPLRMSTGDRRWVSLDAHGFHQLRHYETPGTILSLRRPHDEWVALAHAAAASTFDDDAIDSANNRRLIISDILTRLLMGPARRLLLVCIRPYRDAEIRDGEHWGPRIARAAATVVRHDDILALESPDSLLVTCPSVQTAAEAHLVAHRLRETLSPRAQLLSRLDEPVTLGYALASVGDDLDEVVTYIRDNAQLVP